MEKVFLIDGHAQIFRMYYAFMRRPMINSKGEDTSILFGFTKMLLELIAKEQPTHLAVAFDPPAKTFRHEAFPEYKANRSAAPELVKAALEPLQEILAAFNIPVVMMPGYEADDVIGSMASQWQGNERNIYMVTPDKDYGQLVTEGVFQYKPAKGGNDIEIIGKEQICSHYGICEPQQVIDILTIWGDASDNVPGIKGIGEVGAKKLIGKYGSIEGVIAHAGELSAKQQEAIKDAENQIMMSRFLVTIKTDIALPLGVDDIRIKPLDYGSVYAMFNKFEFNSLRKMLPQQVNTGAPAAAGSGLFAAEENSVAGGLEAAAQMQAMQENCAQMPAIEELELGKLLEIAAQSKRLSIHFTEQQSLILATGSSTICTCVVDDIKELEENNLSGYKKLKNILEESGIVKVGYGFKEHIKRLRACGVDLNKAMESGKLSSVEDIEIMHYLINPERSHKTDLLIKTYLGIDMESVVKPEDGQAEPQPEMFDLFSAPAEPVKAAPSQTEITQCALFLPLSGKVLQELEKANQKELYYSIEMPLIAVLSDMEWQGVKIDTAHLKCYSTELTKELNVIEQQIKDIAQDTQLNVSSPKQVGILLFEKLGLNPKVKKSARGNYPTDEETLTELLHSHPVVGQILEFRALKKLLSTYIDSFPSLISKQTGKLHTTFNQTITATGRLSSTNPNLQNIPIRTERGKEIRKAFIPSAPDGFIVSADYSQIELRLMAHMSGDSDLIDAFNHGKDIHTATAAKVFKVAEDEVTKEQRSRAKVANFGIIYGISAFGLSQRLGMNRTDSKQLIEEYFKNYPGVKEYMNSMIEKAKESGYVETIYGRRRFLPDINSRNAVVRSFNERNAINAPLQGSAADIIKVAMINVYERLKRENLASKMVLQVHDELVFDVVPQEVEQIKQIVKQEMERVIELSIPLIADCNSGKNWLEAH